MSWEDITTTSTVSNRNVNRFICSGERADGTGGIDFGLQIKSLNPFVITSFDPREISSTVLEDPA